MQVFKLQYSLASAKRQYWIGIHADSTVTPQDKTHIRSWWDFVAEQRSSQSLIHHFQVFYIRHSCREQVNDVAIIPFLHNASQEESILDTDKQRVNT